MNLQRVFELESQILEEIRKDNGCSVNFHYRQERKTNTTSETTYDEVTVDVFTLNPVSKEFFLLISCIASHITIALETALQYVRTHKNNTNSYTVKWSREGTSQANTSYFYGKNMKEVLERFYTGKDEALYTIYEIKVNPIS